MLRALLAFALACYPFAVYFLLESVHSGLLIALLGALLCIRLCLVSGIGRGYLSLGIGAALGFCVLAYLDPHLRVLKLYPVAINALALVFCLYSLLNPPSAIERLSNSLGIDVDGPAVPYTRRLTMVWAAFFVISGSIAAYTALASSTGVWALYNGAISYALIGLLIAIEYPVRLRYRKHHRPS